MDNKTKVVLIDADSLIYGVCFTKRETQVEYDNFALYKQQIDQWITNIIHRCEATHYIGCISIGKTFRHSIAKTQEYKSGRPKDKPKFYYELKKHLETNWYFIHEEDLEAEDLVSIIAKGTKYPYIIAGIDHDLYQIPGDHYNYKKDEFQFISEERANFNFWKQMLTGCTTDKIQGIPGIGDKKADALLGWETGNIRYRDIVFDKYISHFGEYNGIIKFTECYQLCKLIDSYTFETEITAIEYVPEVKEEPDSTSVLPGI